MPKPTLCYLNDPSILSVAIYLGATKLLHISEFKHHSPVVVEEGSDVDLIVRSEDGLGVVDGLISLVFEGLWDVTLSAVVVVYVSGILEGL